MATIKIDDHLMLRPWDPADADALFGLINRDRQHLGPWLNWVGFTTKAAHSLEYIHNTQAQMRYQEALALGIFVDGAVAGSVGMHGWSKDTNRAQIGYWIGREHEGKGIVTQALTGFIEYLFGSAGLSKIEIHYVPANARSARVAERLGFRIEGIIRKSIIRNGVPEDLVITGLMRNEWQPAKSRKENAP